MHRYRSRIRRTLASVRTSATGRQRWLVTVATIGTLAATTALVAESDLGMAHTTAAPQAAARPAMDLGVNLFGIQTYNREQVFADLLAQSEWFASRGAGWSAVPARQLDAGGWIRFLDPGQFVTRPFFIAQTPSIRAVRCTFEGKGKLSAGGVAAIVRQGKGVADFRLTSTGASDEGGWLQLDATDPADPLRALDCRDAAQPRGELFDRAFLTSVRPFAAVRFLDWQRVNDNPASRWQTRALPGDATQAGRNGVAVENMVALANEARVDPWFIMPYDADANYIRQFARYVHDHLAPDRKVYVELGNEVWNDMFAASRQARAEGVAAGLAPDDPFRAQMLRYAQKSRDALKIWTRQYASHPDRLIRVAATHNAFPDAGAMILGFEDMARWTDALATAPYIHLDLGERGRGSGDVDWVYAQLNEAIDETLDFAGRNRAIAARYGKRFITYEGGQHLVTRNLVFATAIQRDPRMEGVYARYLDQWRTRFGDRMMLYASTTPISEHGAWGLREYGGQPVGETPKFRAVKRFLAGSR